MKASERSSWSLPLRDDGVDDAARGLSETNGLHETPVDDMAEVHVVPERLKFGFSDPRAIGSGVRYVPRICFVLKTAFARRVASSSFPASTPSNPRS